MHTGRSRIVPTALAILLTLLVAPPGESAATADSIAGRTLTLEECLSLGLRQNPAAEIARQNLAAARGKLDEVKGGTYPTLRLSAAYTYTTPAQTAVASSTDSFDNRFFLKQTLYDAGQTSSLAEGAMHGARALESDLKRSALDIALNVQSSFFEVLRRRDFIAIAEGALHSSGQHVEQAQELHKEGLAPRSDVIKAEVQAANAQLELIRAQNAWLLAKAALSSAVGLPVTTEFALVVPEIADDSPVPSLSSALLDAVAQRPELAAVKARQAAADSAVEQARSGLYPTVSLDASYGWQESEFVPLDTKWSVGVTIGIPVFERRVARARVNQALANRSGLQAAETQTLRAVELEVEQAWLLLKEARERRGAAKKVLEQAEADIRVSEGRYREGLGNILEVIDARTALTQASGNAVIACYDSALALARLDRALGAKIPEERE